MTEGLKLWWQGRTTREQRMLIFLGALVLVIVGWFLILRPLGDTLADSRERHRTAVVQLAETRARVDAIRGLGQRTRSGAVGPIEGLVGQAASEAGFTVQRLEGDGAGRATLAIAAARPQAIFPWISRLEQERGLVVESLTASTNTDQTLAVQIAFRAGGR